MRLMSVADTEEKRLFKGGILGREGWNERTRKGVTKRGNPRENNDGRDAGRDMPTDDQGGFERRVIG